MHPRRLAVCSLALALTACTGGVEDRGPSTFHARGLLLAPGETITVTFNAGSTGIELRPEFTPNDAQLRICRPSADGRGEGCLESVAWGVRTPIRGGNVEAITLDADRAITLGFTAEFFPLGPEIVVELPRAPAAPSQTECIENACRALFELTPVKTGTLTATGEFEGSSGELAVLSGRILARSETATGVPYRVADIDAGAGPLEVRAQLDAGAEFAVVVGQVTGTGAGAIRNVELRMRWP